MGPREAEITRETSRGREVVGSRESVSCFPRREENVDPTTN